ncbi:LacI family DNA-binding transcriptional regulator [Anoxynatronum buryatiense]|uniref:Transcriptional regulator, LacI family n=1 Tax=Anoxynatronum buryatiense TaxID=489973 RepID=A0AA45WX64_9CLOT|nr:LacI family DNA-binding transcriptional regulator [Anoxynatronum buryatiense]SMP61391.1 transcriptional regulator, LacI family [Anoxynatronum buryatiense]
MKFNIKDVAKRAGVSISTVSRVINSSKPVKPKTKDRVLEAIEELGYRPNAIARSLKVKHTQSIGIMVPDIANQFYPEVVRGIEDVANMYEYTIFLCNTDLDYEKELQYFTELEEKQVDGLIFMGNLISDALAKQMADAGIPVVLIGTQHADMPSVTIDNAKAAKDAVGHLIQKGHQRIGIITGKMKDPLMGKARLEGYRQALQEAAISWRSELVVEGGYRFKSGYEGARQLLMLDEMPTAIFVASDEMAIGAMRAILEKGLRIPQDIAIMGFDNVDMAGKVYPSLTTIGQPMYEMGAIGTRLLTKYLQGEAVTASQVVLDYELIERESS